MDVREPENRSACGPTEVEGPRIVMLCAELRDAEPMARSLEKLNSGSLLTYDRHEQLRLNPPVGEVAMFVIVDRESLESITGTLRWLGRRWPRAVRVVVGETGSGRQELTARMGGAIYLVYPAPQEQWQSLVRLAVQSANRAGTPAA